MSSFFLGKSGGPGLAGTEWISKYPVSIREDDQREKKMVCLTRMETMSVLTKIDLFVLPLLLLAAFLSALDKVRIAAIHSHLTYP